MILRWQFDALLLWEDKLCKTHLERPVICNSWYPFAFNLDEDKCLVRIDCDQLDDLKWDMNRHVFENGWPDVAPEERRSLSSRCTRSLIAIWKHLNERHPDVLFDHCASGGGAGNTALARHPIHGRPTPLSCRIDWGMTGWMSIGINLFTASGEKLEQLKQAVADYKLRRAEWAGFPCIPYCLRPEEALRHLSAAVPLRCSPSAAVCIGEDGRRMTGGALMNDGVGIALKGDCDSPMERWSIQELHETGSML